MDVSYFVFVNASCGSAIYDSSWTVVMPRVERSGVFLSTPPNPIEFSRIHRDIVFGKSIRAGAPNFGG
jgi:hypothetical protein